MTITRRIDPLVDPALRTRYSAFVHTVFTSKGHGLQQILPRAAGTPAKAAVKKWLAGQRFRGTPLPRDLSPEQWSELFAIISGFRSEAAGNRR